MLVLHTKSFRDTFYYSPDEKYHCPAESFDYSVFLFIVFDFAYDTDKHLKVEEIAYVNWPYL